MDDVCWPIRTLILQYMDDVCREYSAEPAAVGVLRVVVDPHLGDGRVTDFGLGWVVPLGSLGGGVGVEEALLAVAEDALLRGTVPYLQK